MGIFRFLSTFSRRYRNGRMLFAVGFGCLILELCLVLWAYSIVTNHYSQSSPIDEEKKIGSQLTHIRSYRNKRQPDGFFNGFPVYYHDLSQNESYHSRPYSSVRCVGENYQGPDFAWMHRSCHFRFLCFNMSSKEFEVYARPNEAVLKSIASNRWPLMDISTGILSPNHVRNDTNNGVSLGSGTVRYPGDNIYESDTERLRHQRLMISSKWFPTVVQSSPPERYHALDEDVVFVPFQSVFGRERQPERKPSFVWEDIFPIYTLLKIFQLAPPYSQKKIFPMIYSLDKKLVAEMGTSQPRREHRVDHDHDNLEESMKPFQILMQQIDEDDQGTIGQSRSHHHLQGYKWTNQNDAQFTSSSTQPFSGLICAKDGVAGLGPLGMRTSIYKKSHMNAIHNYGKGAMLWNFRMYCLENLKLLSTNPSRAKGTQSNRSVRVSASVEACSVFSQLTVKRHGNEDVFQTSESIAVSLHNSLLRCPDSESLTDQKSSDQDGSPVSVSVAKINLYRNNMTVPVLTTIIEQMIGTVVFITTCTDAAVTASLFLPRGASLIIIVEPNHENWNGTFDGTEETYHDLQHMPGTVESQLDCSDYRRIINNLSHVRVHWVSLTSGEKLKETFNIIAQEINLFVQTSE